MSGGDSRVAFGVLRASQLCHFLFQGATRDRNENEKAAILAALQDRRLAERIQTPFAGSCIRPCGGAVRPRLAPPPQAAAAREGRRRSVRGRIVLVDVTETNGHAENGRLGASVQEGMERAL